MDDAEARTYQPRVVFVDEANRVLDRGADPARVPAAAPTTSLLRPGTEARPARREAVAGPAMTTVGNTWGAEPAAPPRQQASRRGGRKPAETTDARRLDALLSADH